MSADASGNFVVVWQRWANDVGDVLAQRFDASGARLGDNFLVNSYTTGLQGPAGVALAPDGGSFVIAFSGEQGPGVGIHAKRFDASGSPIGGEFQVNTYTPGPYGGPQIRMDGLGGFVVAWNGSDGHLLGVKARRFFAGGTPRGAEFTVNTYTTNNQGMDIVVPALASDAVGNFVVTWTGSLAALLPKPTSTSSGTAVCIPRRWSSIRRATGSGSPVRRWTCGLAGSTSTVPRS